MDKQTNAPQATSDASPAEKATAEVKERSILKALKARFGAGAKYVVRHKHAIAHTPRDTSKHSRAKTKPRNWRKKKRAARKRAKCTRRRNR
jgi:hypothetical protein